MKTKHAVFTAYRNEANEITRGVHVGWVTIMEGDEGQFDGERVSMAGDVRYIADESNTREEVLALAEVISLELAIPRCPELDVDTEISE